MQVKDLITGAKLVTNNDFVIEQFKKHSDRYKEIKPERKTEETKSDNK